MSQIKVVDTGGQYCHLIARRVREAGVRADICQPTEPADSNGTRGIIISGGPKSVYASDAIRCNVDLWATKRPILGICYGHQLMAKELGGEVRPGKRREYGEADLRVLVKD